MNDDDLLARVAALEDRMAAAEGHAAILDLKSRYGALADARYSRTGPLARDDVASIAEEMAQLFTDDAVWEGGESLGTAVGRGAIRDRFREPTLHYAWHFFVKPDIRVDGDRASGTWDVLAMMTTREGRALWMVGVEYDEYARIEGRWLHSKMRLESKVMAPYDRGWASVSRNTQS